MAKTAHTYDAYRDGYERLLATVQVRPSWRPNINSLISKIWVHKDRYMEIENQTGVPWRFIAVIHSLECGLSFNCHLHNGDPLTKRTRLVPRGHPKAPPANGQYYTWEESAVDALKLKNLHQLTDWSDARVAYELERYNGFGYRQFRINSPYLWSGSNHYSRGKYVADGVWNSQAVSQQTGAMLLYLALSEKPDEVSGETGKAPVLPREEVTELKKTSKGFWAIDKARDFFRWGAGGIGSLGLLEYLGYIRDFLTSWQGMVSIGLILFAIWVLIEYSHYRKRLDVAEGRYVPSGAKDADVPPPAA